MEDMITWVIIVLAVLVIIALVKKAIKLAVVVGLILLAASYYNITLPSIPAEVIEQAKSIYETTRNFDDVRRVFENHPEIKSERYLDMLEKIITK